VRQAGGGEGSSQGGGGGNAAAVAATADQPMAEVVAEGSSTDEEEQPRQERRQQSELTPKRADRRVKRETDAGAAAATLEAAGVPYAGDRLFELADLAGLAEEIAEKAAKDRKAATTAAKVDVAPKLPKGNQPAAMAEFKRREKKHKEAQGKNAQALVNTTNAKAILKEVDIVFAYVARWAKEPAPDNADATLEAGREAIMAKLNNAAACNMLDKEQTVWLQKVGSRPPHA
jgi:hypothetical protein